jgi:hypothetical protein
MDLSRLFSKCLQILNKENLSNYNIQKIEKDNSYYLNVNYEGIVLEEKNKLCINTIKCDFKENKILFNNQIVNKDFLTQLSQKLNKISQDVIQNKAKCSYQKREKVYTLKGILYTN